MIMRLRALILFAGLLVTSPAGAQNVTGRDLMEMCSSTDDRIKVTCYSYLHGAVHMHNLVANPKIFCIPQGVNMNLISLSVMGYLVIYINEENYPADSVIDNALYRLYLCR